jgi:hypothetical protein
VANDKNLIPFTERSESEARESGKKGGVQSGKARREKKAMRELLNAYFTDSAKNYETLSDEAKAQGLRKSATVMEVFVSKATDLAAQKGNLGAILDLLKYLDDGKTTTEHTDQSSPGIVIQIVDNALPESDKTNEGGDGAI